MKPEETYKKLFDSMPLATPRHEISVSIMSRVHKAQIIRIRIRAGIHTSLVIATVSALAPAGQQMLTKAHNSGFFEYASLGMSDSASMISSWKTYAFTIIESAPILETGLVLGLVLVGAYSLRRSASYFSRLSREHRSSYATA
ncbi:MAG TPA: hypothetical protein VL335_03510 [Candidatus Paceibacterota bacterium]|jgi:hypothetical protein|nr:hypothetical protein [Candidatus Paceibacterota bacterium]